MFKGIVDLSFPTFIKYLFWGSSQNKGLFEETPHISSAVSGRSGKSGRSDRSGEDISPFGTPMSNYMDESYDDV